MWISRFVRILIVCFASFTAQADPLNCKMDEYLAQEGLTAEVDEDTLVVYWQGEDDVEWRTRFYLQSGAPIIRDISIRQQGDIWQVASRDLRPEFRVVSGIRRVTQQQTEPLEGLGMPLTEELLNEIKWDAFWDAPLYVSDEPPRSHQSSIPAEETFANHPGMPRKAEEITRAIAVYQVVGCEVRTNGARIEVIFQGVEAGIFQGYLQYDFFKGSNLIRQMLVARTDHPSAAFKYDAGLQGLPVSSDSRLVWRDLSNRWQEYRLGGPANAVPVILKSSNRLIAAELQRFSMAAFPPPHSFYWARESEQNLGYSWYRRDKDDSFSFGIRQAELEEDPEFYHNFALYSARPGTWQRMPVFFQLSPKTGKEAVDRALDYTHGDRFKGLPGYKVMGHHYHVGMVRRLKELGGFDQRLNDIETTKGIGIDIFSIIDGVRGPARHDKGEAYLDALAEYYEAARHQSDRGFLVMPNDENSTDSRPPFIGGHYDIIISKPLFWRPRREEGWPLAEPHPEYGTVFNLEEPMDLLGMTEQADAILSMPHPNSKRSTGYPEAIKDAPQFTHENYFSLGYRWGMGIDASSIRLGEFRFLKLWDETNNWMVAQGRPVKFALAISEARSDLGHRGKPPYDDAYGMSPVNYLQLDTVPTVDDMSSIVNVLKNGDYFITSGEVLIPYFRLEGEGAERTVIAEVEWTFPLDFVEIVWGDGETVDRKVISTTDLPPFGSKRFEIPLDVKGKKWIRFAAWDIATNGALVQPLEP